ncbi:MAG: pilus assembly protein N-terminal domain-containing protein [Xanthobacteraceae bacterium]|nr:pilus assembly protein N-terminal domain-containing protein [Xanthobacteraceae bacterium]MBX9829847.1 pilus assembly protein N-terminal domain-containing protein [Xanthobacteraceae bacterium]
MRLFSVRLFALCFLAAAAISGPSGTVQAADITVVLDQARLVKLPDRVATIVVGNPVIADAAVQSGGWMVITGKGYGLTNIVALDRSGAVLMEKSIEVQAPQDVVVVYRGVERDTYSCTPECSRRLTLGDGNAFFELVAGQITARNGLAAGSVQSR